MKRLLVLDASPRGAESSTRAVTAAIRDGVHAAVPDTEIDEWNLWDDPLPPFGPAEVAAKMAVIGADTPDAAVWQRLENAFRRFDAADTYVFGVPMWNGGIPWVLKLFIDTVTQPGLLFRFDPASGYHGLLRHKRAVVVYASAVYRPGLAPAFGRDFQSTYFEDWLRFAGIDDVRPVRIPPFRAEERGARIAAAIEAGRAAANDVASTRV
jgi:FMN-dependent NADH-azoreductase